MCSTDELYIFQQWSHGFISSKQALCVCKMAADSLEADHEEATYILADSLMEI